jgi:esterase/lipase
VRKKWLFIIPPAIILLYLAGPSPSRPVYAKDLPAVPSDPAGLEAYVSALESPHRIKPDNEARIVWAGDSTRRQTPYSIVYLHGFSASQAEGEPVHRNIAREYGCNLYLSRLAEHGIDTSEEMINLTADKLWESSKQALAIGKQLGKKVILMGTSTGGTLALKLAATFPEDIAGLVLLSPNIAINDDKAWILNNHWGLQIARLVRHSKYIDRDTEDPLDKKYWNRPYRLEAVVELQELLETSMKEETFRAVKQPALVLYYYRDTIHQDSVVKVTAIRAMFDQLGTPRSRKREMAIPNAGNHVIGSYIKSGDVPGVQREIEKFMNETMRIPALQPSTPRNKVPAK